jgi:hypothetical protein
MVLLLLLTLVLLGILLARVLRAVLLGAVAVLIAGAIWFIWNPTTAWPVLRPVVRPAALSLQHHMVRDLHLYAQWAIKSARPKPARASHGAR